MLVLGTNLFRYPDSHRSNFTSSVIIDLDSCITAQIFSNDGRGPRRSNTIPTNTFEDLQNFDSCKLLVNLPLRVIGVWLLVIPRVLRGT